MPFLNRCVWISEAGGLSDFVVAGAAKGGYTPEQCLDPVVINGETYHYSATQGADHEEGDGFYTISANTLTRAIIRNSSTGGNLINFGYPPIIRMGGPTASDILDIAESDEYEPSFDISTGDYTVTNEKILLINKTSATAHNINLPTSVNRNNIPIVIKDVAGNAATYIATIIPNGAETIDGLATLPIDSNYGGFKLTPITGGWYISP